MAATTTITTIFLSMLSRAILFTVFFFNDTATTEIYTLSLHDALPICIALSFLIAVEITPVPRALVSSRRSPALAPELARISLGRSEEHTSELQSRLHLVCRLLLEKKKS